jgi:hypothetical protein
MYFEDRTRVGVFADQKWQYDYYIGFFKEMVERSGVITRLYEAQEFCQIDSDIYNVRIFLGQQIQRGHKFDIVFSDTISEAIRREVLIPTLCSSKFSKRSFQQ